MGKQFRVPRTVLISVSAAIFSARQWLRCQAGTLFPGRVKRPGGDGGLFPWLDRHCRILLEGHGYRARGEAAGEKAFDLVEADIRLPRSLTARSPDIFLH